MIKTVAAAVVAGLILGGATGCTVPTDLSESAFVGEWRAADGATLVLTNDGSLEVSQVPKDAWYASAWSPSNFSGSPLAESIDASGRWRFLPDGAGSQIIEVTSHEEINYLVLIEVGPPLTIGFVLGDPDSHDYYEFTKRD